jgi:CBS-domain-containing membrane protein
MANIKNVDIREVDEKQNESANNAVIETQKLSKSEQIKMLQEELDANVKKYQEKLKSDIESINDILQKRQIKSYIRLSEVDILQLLKNCLSDPNNTYVDIELTPSIVNYTYTDLDIIEIE